MDYNEAVKKAQEALTSRNIFPKAGGLKQAKQTDTGWDIQFDLLGSKDRSLGAIKLNDKGDVTSVDVGPQAGSQ